MLKPAPSHRLVWETGLGLAPVSSLCDKVLIPRFLKLLANASVVQHTSGLQVTLLKIRAETILRTSALMLPERWVNFTLVGLEGALAGVIWSSSVKP